MSLKVLAVSAVRYNPVDSLAIAFRAWAGAGIPFRPEPVVFVLLDNNSQQESLVQWNLNELMSLAASCVLTMNVNHHLHRRGAAGESRPKAVEPGC